MKVIEVTQNDHHKYDEFVKKHPLGSIHQTWKWGLFQSKNSLRDRFWVFAVEDDHKKIVASALIIRQKFPFKKCWLYCPRGPLADYTPSKNGTFQLLLQKIQELAKVQQAVFLRFDPGIVLEKWTTQNEPTAPDINLKHVQKPIPEEIHQTLRAMKAHPAHAHYQPENTLILDLSSSPDQLLKQMKPKGRYNIKVAQKHHVVIHVSHNSPQDITAFHNLLQQTTNRDAFFGHPQKYYEDMLTVLGQEKAKLYLAEYQQKIVAAIIVTFFNNTAIYYFGASGNEHRNVMAPYLLQWKAIQDAKADGCKYYDFLGIAPHEAKNHPWAGVTDFKLKFGGTRIDYLPAREIVYKPLWYFAIKLIKKFQ